MIFALHEGTGTGHRKLGPFPVPRDKVLFLPLGTADYQTREHVMEDNEFGSSTGDARENDASLPGFTENEDRLFRSQSQHAFRFGYDAAGNPRFAGKEFEEVEKDLEGNWLNVRSAGDEWQSVRDDARLGYERGRQIGIAGVDGVIGESPTHDRPSFADPVAEGIDPTSPESPERAEEP